VPGRQFGQPGEQGLVPFGPHEGGIGLGFVGRGHQPRRVARIERHDPLVIGHVPHAFPPAGGDDPHRQGPGFTEGTEVLNQAQPYGLRDILGFRSRQPEPADHAGEKRAVAVHDLVPRLLVSVDSRVH
jgi:hypothetical protein